MQPLEPEDGHHGKTYLGVDWYRVPMAHHCDESMPAETRDRLSKMLETDGDAGDMIRGEAWCPVCKKLLGHSERTLPGDPIANTMELVWEPVALAHMVTAHGLTISPALLLARFGVLPDGTRPVFL